MEWRVEARSPDPKHPAGHIHPPIHRPSMHLAGPSPSPSDRQTAWAASSSAQLETPRNFNSHSVLPFRPHAATTPSFDLPAESTDDCFACPASDGSRFEPPTPAVLAPGLPIPLRIDDKATGA